MPMTDLTAEQLDALNKLIDETSAATVSASSLDTLVLMSGFGQMIWPILPQLLAMSRRTLAAEAECRRLLALINSPHNADWFEGTRIEAAHQQERCGTEHDGGKEPQEWFWLIGYLAGKCLRASIDGDSEKAKHHTISTAAVLLNWYRRIAGTNTAMRPGIEPPTESEADRG